MGTHLKVLGENYSLNTNMTWFRWFSEIFVSLCFGCRKPGYDLNSPPTVGGFHLKVKGHVFIYQNTYVTYLWRRMIPVEVVSVLGLSCIYF